MNPLASDQIYMQRCIDIARLGQNKTAPNPMVGAVLVHNNRIVAEGFHEYCGGPHAEVNAIAKLNDDSLLRTCTLYVSLEPCAHHGRTPPCSDLIVDKKIPRVVIGSVDSNSKVAGKGIEKLRRAGIEVTLGVLEDECRELNKRFFTFFEKKRPYIVLKWAESADGYMDINRPGTTSREPYWISNALSRALVHKWRSEEQAILVGSGTAIIDNPQLNVRDWSGSSPLRILIDRHLKTPANSWLYDNTLPTWVFTHKQHSDYDQLRFFTFPSDINLFEKSLLTLYENDIQSVFVEGGQTTLRYFIDSGLWDEARIFRGPGLFHEGVKAPSIIGNPIEKITLLKDIVWIYRNKN